MSDTPKRGWLSFSIRDLLWATLVVGMAFGWGISNYGWWRSSQAAYAERDAVTRKAIRLRDTLRNAKKENDYLQDWTLRALRAHDAMAHNSRVPREKVIIDWGVLDEPIP